MDDLFSFISYFFLLLIFLYFISFIFLKPKKCPLRLMAAAGISYEANNDYLFASTLESPLTPLSG